MDAARPEPVVLQVVLAHPHQFNRLLNGFRNEHGLADEIVFQPAAEAATGSRYANVDIQPIDTCHLVNHLRGTARRLHGCNQQCAIILQVN